MEPLLFSGTLSQMTAKEGVYFLNSTFDSFAVFKLGILSGYYAKASLTTFLSNQFGGKSLKS